jgi:hypothetical protein
MHAGVEWPNVRGNTVWLKLAGFQPGFVVWQVRHVVGNPEAA